MDSITYSYLCFLCGIPLTSMVSVVQGGIHIDVKTSSRYADWVLYKDGNLTLTQVCIYCCQEIKN